MSILRTPRSARRLRRPGWIGPGVEVLGRLPPVHVAVSGFDVTAVVAWWQRRSPVAPADAEESGIGMDGPGR